MFLPEHYEFSCPVKINSGNRALEHIPFELDTLNARKPFVITSKDAAKRGLVDIIIDAFKDSGITIGIFDSVPPSPDLKLIRELFTIYRDRGYDAIIAIGGGPVTDTAKALNIVVSGEPEDLERYAGDDLIKKPLKPFIVVPTLSGTGYETSRYAFFEGRVYTSHYLMPDLVVIDPRMTIAEDAKTTASITLVALTHAVEAYTCPGKNPLADAHAYAAIQFIMENLVNVVRNPQDGNGRLALANAHTMAACAFSNMEAGIVHKLGKVVGDACQLPHGLCMGVLLPHILGRQLSEGGYYISDLLLPLAGFDTYADTAENMKAQKAIGILYNFQKELFDAGGGAIIRTLKDAEVPKEILKDIAQKAVGYGSNAFNEDGYLTVLEQAWEGR
ncbi:MAG: iron-containing alcohol dehydrogenase [Deltaproteobacteria bacterium]|nr:iron-containing alcohol dehydrogenase [Deltaproteobacteria bacterium]